MDSQSVATTGKNSRPPQGTVEWTIRDMDRKANLLDKKYRKGMTDIKKELDSIEKISKSKIQSMTLPPTTEDRASPIGKLKVVVKPPQQPVTEKHSKEETKEPKNLVGTPPTRNIH